MEVKPYTALVIWPLVVAREVGRAKNALNERLCPSRRKIRLGRSASSGPTGTGFLDSLVFAGATTADSRLRLRPGRGRRAPRSPLNEWGVPVDGCRESDLTGRFS